MMKFNWDVVEGVANIAIAALAPLTLVAWIVGRL